MLEEKLRGAELENRYLRELLRLARIEKYGPGSEKLADEQLDVEPAKHFVLVTKREKRACRRCEEQGVQCAPLPPRIIEKGLASDRVVIDTVVNKYCAHLPLFRQSAMLERETGLEISRVTLCGWVMAVGEMLMPIVGAMRRELLSGGYIQADETPLDQAGSCAYGRWVRFPHLTRQSRRKRPVAKSSFTVSLPSFTSQGRTR
jgi:transposase